MKNKVAVMKKIIVKKIKDYLEYLVKALTINFVVKTNF